MSQTSGRTAPSSPAYRSITTVQAIAPLNTASLFNSAPSLIEPSPIDQFIANTNAINVIYLPSSAASNAELGTLVLLGYMSAVESYFRAVIRGLINVDARSRLLAEPHRLSFGAALHHKPNLLPEAILEEISFAGGRNVETTLREVVGIKGQLPNEVQVVLAEYSKICEIRHCCVHRFGKLGANNAIRLGLDSHKQSLEMPFSPTKENLEDISDLLRTFVKTINNFLFQSVLDRSSSINNYDDRQFGEIWHWNYNKDRRKFGGYYGLFASASDNPPSPNVKDVYSSFKLAVADYKARKARRNGTARQPAVSTAPVA